MAMAGAGAGGGGWGGARAPVVHKEQSAEISI